MTIALICVAKTSSTGGTCGVTLAAPVDMAPYPCPYCRRAMEPVPDRRG